MTGGVEWRRPAGPPALGATDVHVWRVRLDAPDDGPALLAVLADDERERLARFVFPRLGERYVTARGRLRLLLARYLGVDAAVLRFVYGPRGKPALAEGAHADLRFNLSHSGDLALVAVTRGREVGVDVEADRPDFATEATARRFFSAAEVEAFLALPPASRHEAFFRCWTRKEAYIKALGDGLALPLDSFDVAIGEAATEILLATRPDPAEARRWRLAALAPGAGYAGAVAVEGQGWRLQCWDWDG